MTRKPRRWSESASRGDSFNPDMVQQARAKPELRGWFVGQVMKAMNGRADVDDVVYKVNQTFVEQIALGASESG